VATVATLATVGVGAGSAAVGGWLRGAGTLRVCTGVTAGSAAGSAVGITAGFAARFAAGIAESSVTRSWAGVAFAA